MGEIDETLRALIETRSALLTDVDTHADTTRFLALSDLTGTMQLFEFDGVGPLHQVTDLADRLAAGCYVPGTRLALVAADRAGDESFQLSLVDLEAVRSEGPVRGVALDPVTEDPRYMHLPAGVSRDGSTIAYVSNRRNGVDFDLWVCDLASREHRCIYDGGGWCQPTSGFSPSGRWVSVLRPGARPLDMDLLVVDVATGEVTVVLDHPDEAAIVGEPAWIGDTTILVSSNVGREFARIVRVELESGRATGLAWTGIDADADVSASDSGKTVVVTENRNGASRMFYVDADGESEGSEISLPEPGVTSEMGEIRPIPSVDGTKVYFSLLTPRMAGDVWCFDRAANSSTRLTTSPSTLVPGDLAGLEVHETVSFDGERIPMFVLRPPDATGSVPVVVSVHGGPEWQSNQTFDPVGQALVSAGYAVVYPNVRGSTGYGERFAALDDTTRRLDAVRDLEAVHDWIRTAGFDASRAALWGGSYGGYMVLAGVAFQPDRWAAGVDIVGISDLVTFLENTSDYRRSHREREYGSLEHDREFLKEASPMQRVDSIRAPLFVIHGRNDPRVPVSEAEQLAANLVARGVRCDLVIYEDEGHGIARLENRLDAIPRAIRFLDEVLGVDA